MSDTLRLDPNQAAKPPVARPVSFYPGDVVGGRYQVVRFLARGGMGDVYEVEDVELHERVALKTIRPDLALDSTTLERFRREISLARKVTHPNVCRVLELGFHRVRASEPDLAFLTMELLSGETLEHHLLRRGKLPLGEALALAAQMADGLAAAHRVGVVHRDFKSGNVLLVPDGSGYRAVITDFGLAIRHDDGTGGKAASVTSPGIVVGTPDYMSPEQAAGEDATPASDVYSFGVVLYELVAGVRPYGGLSPVASFAKRLAGPPPSPRTHTPDLPVEWDRAILGCLSPEPAERHASPLDAIRVISGHTAVTRITAAPARRGGVALLVAAAALALGAVVYQVVSSRSPARVTASAARRSVAVLGFRNLSGKAETAWLSTALAEMLSTELAGGARLRVVPGETVARTKLELGLADADGYGKETLGRLRENLGADVVLVGSYLATGSNADAPIRLDLKLQDAVAGETVGSIAEAGTEAKLIELVARAGTRLREALGAAALSAKEAVGLQASRPGSPEAARLYTQGLAKLRVFDGLAAQELLAEAVARDARWAPAHAALAEAYAAHGYDARAAESAQKALALAPSLAREERLAVEARAHGASGDHEKAARLYGVLFDLFPDDVEVGLLLARHETLAGRAAKALETVKAIRALGSPPALDPRVDLAEAAAAGSLSDFALEKAAASKAVERAGTRGARLVVARARVLLGEANVSLGDVAAGAEAFERARRAFDEAGDREGVAVATNHRATLAWSQGEFARARELYDAALASRRASGNKGGVARTLLGIGNVLSEQGFLAEARARFDEALVLLREVGDRNGVASALINTGGTLCDAGKPGEAEPMLLSALDMKRAIGDKRGEARALNRLGEALLARGQVAAAAERYREGLAVAQATGHKGLRAFLRTGLGAAFLARGELAAARRELEAALADRVALGQRVALGESRLALARLLLAEGKPAEAERLAAEAQGAFEEGRVAFEVQAAFEVRARAFLALGRAADARSVLDGVSDGARKSEYAAVRFAVRRTEARLLAEGGAAAEAQRRLEALLVEAAADGLAETELETRLDLAEVERAAGLADAASRRLRAIESEAAAKGFGRIARIAAERARSRHASR